MATTEGVTDQHAVLSIALDIWPVEQRVAAMDRESFSLTGSASDSAGGGAHRCDGQAPGDSQSVPVFQLRVPDEDPAMIRG